MCTGSIEQDGRVEAVIQGIKLQTLCELFDCFFILSRCVKVGTFFLDFIHLSQIPPCSLVVNIIGILVKSFTDVFLAHVKIGIVDKKSASPEEVLGIVNELILQFGRILNGLLHLVLPNVGLDLQSHELHTVW